MFNAEKYLSVCLESILNQTFTDFELLVVDDCSTDSSPEIAESYLERFGGRMKIISLEKNTGSGAVPRNVGLDFATGKYVYFMDNDDFIIDTALEELFDAAEKFRADVVYMEKYFSCEQSPVPEKLAVSVWCNAKTFVEEPTLETNDISKRVEKCLNATFCWAPWANFLRRDFLVDNKIFLPQMTICDDVIWTLKIRCLAKKILHVPTPLYVHRENPDSVMLRKRSPEQMIQFRTSPIITGADILDEFMRERKFFRDNPVMRLQVLNFFVLMQLDNMTDAIKALDSTELYEIFLREFLSTGSPNAALISYLLVMNNLYRNELRKRTQ